MSTPEAAISALEVTGGQIVVTVTEPRLHHCAAVIEAHGGALAFHYTASPEHAAPVP